MSVPQGRPADPAEYRDATGDADEIDRALNDPESLKAIEKAALTPETKESAKESIEQTESQTSSETTSDQAEDWKSKFEALKSEHEMEKSAREKALKSVEWSKRTIGKLSEQLRNARSGSGESEENEEEEETQIRPQQRTFQADETERVQAEWDFFFSQNPRLIQREKQLGELLSPDNLSSDPEVADCLSYIRGTDQIDVSKTLKSANRLLTERSVAKASEKASKVSQTVAQAQNTAAASGAPVRTSGFSAETNPFDGITEAEMLDNPGKYYAEHSKALLKAGLIDRGDLPKVLRHQR